MISRRKFVAFCAAALAGLFLSNSAWAAIAFVNGTKGTSSSSPFSVTKPTGAAQGDTLIIAVSVQTGTTIAAPSGFTAIFNQTSGIVFYVVYKVLGASEPSSYSFGNPGSQFLAWAAADYSGASSTPIDASGLSGVQTNQSTSITAPSISPTGSTDMLVGVWGADASLTFTKPASMTSREAQAGSSGSVLIADQLLSASGPTGTRTATMSTGPNDAIGGLIALTAGGTPPPPTCTPSIALLGAGCALLDPANDNLPWRMAVGQ